MEYWLYEGKRVPSSGLSRGRRQVEGGVQSGAAAVSRDASGVLRRQGTDRGHGPRRHPRVAELPVVHALLRPALHTRRGQGARPAVPPGLQRLDDRGVVRRRARPLHPAHAHPAVGPAARGRGDRALRRPRASPRSRSPRTPSRSGCRPSTTPRLLGSGHAGGQRPRAWSSRCTSARRRRCPKICSRLAVHGQPRLGCGAHVGRDAVVDLRRHVPAVPEHQDRTVRGRDRLDPVLPRAGQAGARQAAALGGKGATFVDHAGAPAALDLDDPRRPSGYLDHIYGCFIDDAHGIGASTRSARTT